LRHYIVPEFKRLNPSFEQTMAKELEILQEVNGLVINEVEKKKKAISTLRNDAGKIDIAKLLKTGSARLLLFEMLKEFGFNPTQVANIYEALDGLPGKIFISETHTLVKDRKHLVIKKKSAKSKDEISIYKNTEEITEPVNLNISYVKLKKGDDTKIPALKNFAYLDADKLKFPLTLAKWKLGDKFRPLGMKDFKKLSDFFIGEKMNLFEKENQWVLHSGKEIVWVLDRRIDDRFKITDKTKRICIIELNG
jgi:tRNA(Ile)-lysidine synthase